VTRSAAYEKTARAIARYLAQRQQPDGGFPGPDHYGVACSLWLWSRLGEEFAEPIERALQRLERSPPTGHGEFNAYALLHCRNQLGEDRIDALLRRTPFGRRHSANWMLLRSVCRALPGPLLSPRRSALAARAALLRYARAGFIADRRGAASLTYHAFCGALLADLWRERGRSWAGRAAIQAADVAAQFVLANGDGLYIGRGQQQIFGYGALLYLLESAAEAAGRADLAEAAERVRRRLRRFQRDDGSFPLVLREGEEPEPWRPDSRRPGWYTYNRYADYLPFLGCMLLKASRTAAPAIDGVEPVGLPPRAKVRREVAYTAVLTVSGGASTNDLPFPYVCVRGESLFPCYGSEEDVVDPRSVPLPYGVLAEGEQYAFQSRLRYRLAEHDLLGDSREIRHLRRFEFAAEGFCCCDEIVFRRRQHFAEFVPANFLFRSLKDLGAGEFETSHGEARARLRLTPAGRAYQSAAVTASGALAALRHGQGALDTEPGDRITVELKVHFL
jgi:hypothetical protein